MPMKDRFARIPLEDAEWAVVVALAAGAYPKNPRGQAQTGKALATLVRLGMVHAIECCYGDPLELRREEREILKANLVRRRVDPKLVERMGRRNR